MNPRLRNPSFTESLYSLYCRFLAESGEAVLNSIKSPSLRDSFRRTNRPLAMGEFVERLDEMSADKRSRFIRRMSAGFDFAQLLEGSQLQESVLDSITTSTRHRKSA